MYNVAELGQVFTPKVMVKRMMALRRNNGRTLEPSSGAGAFVRQIPNCVGIEIDPKHSSTHSLQMDFFDYPISEKFETIIGNPPYVRYQDILESTKSKLTPYKHLFDERSNLYLFFIAKCIAHLPLGGELIFITPRDFLKATSSIRLNEWIYQQGTITDIIDLGDDVVFKGYAPNCVIFRFEKANFNRILPDGRKFACNQGQLIFAQKQYPIKFSDIFMVKVGAVSGNDKIFTHPKHGNTDFVCSSTVSTGKTKRMIFNSLVPYLEQYKEVLLARKIKKFDDNNWWHWGRMHYDSPLKRVYVNSKTRKSSPFFTHASPYYDGSVLAIFPKKQELDMQVLAAALNAVNWRELGFVCDNRFIFSQKSLQNAVLPIEFSQFLP